MKKSISHLSSFNPWKYFKSLEQQRHIPVNGPKFSSHLLAHFKTLYISSQRRIFTLQPPKISSERYFLGFYGPSAGTTKTSTMNIIDGSWSFSDLGLEMLCCCWATSIEKGRENKVIRCLLFTKNGWSSHNVNAEFYDVKGDLNTQFDKSTDPMIFLLLLLCFSRWLLLGSQESENCTRKTLHIAKAIFLDLNNLSSSFFSSSRNSTLFISIPRKS